MNTSLGKFDDLTDTDEVRVRDSVQVHEFSGGGAKPISNLAQAVPSFNLVCLGSGLRSGSWFCSAWKLQDLPDLNHIRAQVV
jgi:hypothetical protein